MATLNTLRTRFGILLSAVIAFALIAFIFSLKSEMGFSGNDPVVAEIDGTEVTYSHYQREYDNIMRLSGVSEVDERMAEMLSNATWQALISQVALEPALEEMGFVVSEAERAAIIRGEVVTQTLMNSFRNPQTGQFDAAAITNFLYTSQGNPEAQQIWATVMNQAIIERNLTKYNSLVARGAYANALEVKNAVDASARKADGRWAIKRYSSVADSLVSIDKSAAERFYNENKSLYKRQATRTMSYVSFPINPSVADETAIAAEAKNISDAFAKSNDLRAYLREIRKGSITPNYLPQSALVAAEAELLSAGRMYGPMKVGQTWRMSRVEDKISAPDTITLSHIVLSYTDEKKADSLLVALRKGADFAEAAKSNSIYSQTAQMGGDLGATPFIALQDEFVEALKGAKTGDVVKIEISDMIQIVKVTKTGKYVPHYRVASIELPILPSDKTRMDAHNKAGLFVAEATSGGLDAFQDAAGELEVSTRSAEITSSMRRVSAIPGSYEIARWANNANVGDLSQIFKVDDGYCVAMLTEINDDEYDTFATVKSTIERQLRNEAKAEMIKSQISGATFDEQAASLGNTTGTFEGINWSSYSISGIGAEAALIGAISARDSEGLASVVEGGSGVIVFEVTKIVDTSAEAAKAEDEKVRLESLAERMMQYSTQRAVESMIEIEDNRGAVL